MLESIKRWLSRRYRDPFTVACDISPLWTPLNSQERLFRVNDLARARSTGRRWVAMHPYDQARILEGHHWWPEER
jgi:hypothetical protein